MAYPAGTFLHFVMHFGIGATDSAQVTSNWSFPEATNTFVSDVNRLHSRAGTFWAAINGYYNNQVAYRGTSAYLQPLNGNALEVIHTPITPNVGASGSAMLPQEVSPVVSTQAAGAGPSQRGRMYLPPPTLNQITSSGRLTTTFQGGIADAMKAFLDPLAGPILRSCVWSRKNASNSPIVGIRVGDVFDVQRRRRNDTIESYTTRTLAA